MCLVRSLERRQWFALDTVKQWMFASVCLDGAAESLSRLGGRAADT